jgi:tRNA-specific 2-thiouridylase
MLQTRKRIVVAMSGGVDSSVAAALLVEQGHTVQAVSLRMWEENRGARVCSDHRGAKEVARALGVPHTSLDYRSQFARDVVQPFARDYLRGRTPNPCVACNRDFKLGALLDWARVQRVDYVATGHYAKLVRADGAGGVSLHRGVDQAKDQSYFLFALSKEQLRQALFPLGDMRKDDVRSEARRLGLAVAERPESQDICFGDYKALVQSRAGTSRVSGGEVVDRSGAVLGRHTGIHGFTIGQRRGLGVAAAERLYVVEIDSASDRVVLGRKEDLSCAGLIVSHVNWIEPPARQSIQAEVQIRYRSQPVPCTVVRLPDDSWRVSFREPLPGVAPGQAAVFYRGTQVLGGGWIERALALGGSLDPGFQTSSRRPESEI